MYYIVIPYLTQVVHLSVINFPVPITRNCSTIFARLVPDTPEIVNLFEIKCIESAKILSVRQLDFLLSMDDATELILHSFAVFLYEELCQANFVRCYYAKIWFSFSIKLLRLFPGETRRK